MTQQMRSTERRHRQRPHRPHRLSRERLMAWAFAAGATCFLVGPFPGYLALVGSVVDATTFFVGSLLFTAGGALQVSLAVPRRGDAGAGRAAWWTAIIQCAGTLFFNVTTYRALHTALTSSTYDQLVWRPDAFGSICFLLSGLIAYHASARRGWLPLRGAAGWWQPAVNLLGCVLFGVAAVAGYVVPSNGSMLDVAAANWTTAAGAACFLACAGGALRGGRRHHAEEDRSGPNRPGDRSSVSPRSTPTAGAARGAPPRATRDPA